jgi:hypothetical protein
MSLDDEQKKIFEERLAKEIEDAKYAKWKSEQVNHSVAPSKKIANDVLRRGTWISIGGAVITLAFSDYVVAEVVGLIVCFFGLIMLYSGLAIEHKRRKEMGI